MSCRSSRERHLSALPRRRFGWQTPPEAMTELDRQKVAEWIGDAFAILCVRISSASAAEKNLRLGFETMMRQLGTPPLRMVTRGTAPAFCAVIASKGDLRTIVKALDCCLAIFHRYEAVLTEAQRRIQILVRATKRYAEEELSERSRPRAALEVKSAA